MKEQSEKRLGTAVALRYTGQGAPRLSAKGRGEVAKKILRLAEENDVPIHEDEDLAYLLSTIDLGQEIPRQLYLAVAEVLAFAYALSGKVPPEKDVTKAI